MVYAKNDKPGCYTGFYKLIPGAGRFNHQQFLAAHALPGPDSMTDCILQEQGPLGNT